MPIFGEKKEKEVKLTRAQRKLFVNRVLQKNQAIFTFSGKTRFAERFVSNDEGEIRESSFTPNSVYWIIEARDDEGNVYTLDDFLAELEAEQSGG